MSAPKQGRPRPVVPPRPVPRIPPTGRLASLKNPSNRGTPVRRPHPSTTPQAIPRSQDRSSAQPQIAKSKPAIAYPPSTTTCPNPNCPGPNIVDEEGQKLCTGCGTVISESNIVSEVTFGESASGAAIVQGTFVAADQSHGRSFGPGFQRGGGIESREMTEQNGNRYMQQLARALYIPESAVKAAGQVFKLAVGLNFIQGRRTKTVAAVSLYIACRRQEGNTVMLIDFADVLMINVFKLGRAYKALLGELLAGRSDFFMNPIDPESLIYRFAKQLEFGTATMQVASEAVRIVQRMNRDWMTIGRRPAGICGAALILAARMNNFRRSVREVVYVVKVTEITINQRLNEFSSTESGELTVDQFRSVQLENSHDPPSFTQAREGKSGRPKLAVSVAGRKRKAGGETAAEIEGDDLSTAGPAHTKRIDADGFAIPEIPIDPALTSPPNAEQPPPQAQQLKPKRGRPKGPRPKLPPPTAAEIASEEALENEMNELLAIGSGMMESATRASSATDVISAAATPALAPQAVHKPISDLPDIDASEFDDDPEVANCLLTPAEADIKERIWVHENKEYLRAQQAKAVKQALMQSDSPSGQGTSKPRKRRRGRMGDVRYLEGEEGADGERSSRASTPAEATRRMLEKRGFSKKINYRLLESLYGSDAASGLSDTDSRGKAGRSVSRSQSVLSDRSASVDTDADVDGPLVSRSAMNRQQPKTTIPGASKDSITTQSSTILSATATQPSNNPQVVTNTNREAINDDAEDEDEDEEDEDEEEEEDERGGGGRDDEDDGVEAALRGEYNDYYDESSDNDSE